MTTTTQPKTAIPNGLDLRVKSSGEAQRPPESGGQHDRDEVEIVRGEVPKPIRTRFA